MLMDSRLSGLELCVSIRRENFRREKKLKNNKENFILMDSHLSGLELCVSIRCSCLSGLELCVSIRCEKKIKKK